MSLFKQNRVQVEIIETLTARLERVEREKAALEFRLEESQVFKEMIAFAQDRGILRFRYKDFDFDLSKPKAEQSELEVLKEEFLKLRSIVNGLTMNEDFRRNAKQEFTGNQFAQNRAEALAMRLGQVK